MSPRAVVAVAVFFISLSAIFIRLASAPSLAIATYRMAFSTLFLLPLFWTGAPSPAVDRPAARAGKNGSPRSGALRLFAGMTRADALLSVASGAFLGLHFATWIASVDMTSIESSTVLVNLQPIFVLAGGALILGERSSRRSVLFILVTIAGCALLAVGDARLGEHHLAGDGLALLGAFFVSGYIIIGRIVRRRVSARGYTLIVYFSSTLVLLVLDLATRTPLWPYPPLDWLLFAALALFCTLLGHSLLNWALKYLTATLIATSVLGEPVIATLLAIPIFGAIPTLLGALGAAVTIAGLYLFIRSEQEGARPGGREKRGYRHRT